MPVLNPASGKEIGYLSRADKEDLGRAAEAARQAFEAWRKTPSFERTIMHKAVALMRERDAAIAALITQEEGKLLAEAASEANGLEALEGYPNTRSVSIVGT